MLTPQGQELKQIIDRIERLEEKKQEIQEDIKDVYQNAKSRGFIIKILKLLIKERKMEDSDLQEQLCLLDTYRHSLIGNSGSDAKS